jgi:hypothetical protein
MPIVHSPRTGDRSKYYRKYATAIIIHSINLAPLLSTTTFSAPLKILFACFAVAGIANFRLSAVCEAVQRRDLEQADLSQTLLLAEPDTYADDRGYYCSAEDFPCEGAGNVHICHYEPRRGYQTFCLPEADSEVLRFHSNDYRGACVGGYNRIKSLRWPDERTKYTS